MSTPIRLSLPRQLLAEMIAHARAELPNECCGLLAGTIDAAGIARVTRRYPLVNKLASPTEYFCDDASMLAAWKDTNHGADIRAVYHSHPTTPPVPSQKDREQNYMGDEVMHFIIGLSGDEPEVRAWWLTIDEHRTATWEII